MRIRRMRRPAAALFAAAAVGLGLLAIRPAPPPSVEVVVAAHDLRGGTVVKPADVRTVAFPRAAVPDGALRPGALTAEAPKPDAPQVPGARRPIGRRLLAGPMRKGEPLTDMRFLDGGLLDGYGPGVVAVPVRIADAGAVRLLRPGDRVDVLAVSGPALADPGVDTPGPAPPSRARVVASAIPVIALPRDHSSPEQGALIVLAAGKDQAQTLAAAAGSARLSLTITGA